MLDTLYNTASRNTNKSFNILSGIHCIVYAGLSPTSVDLHKQLQ